MIDGLISAIEARKHKAKNNFLINRLNNARLHLKNAMDEVDLGILAIEQFDKEANK